MGLARAHAIALVGVQGHPVEIEADIENGMVALLLVGLPDTALREARDRIRSAIVNSGEAWPARRITVGLSPASLPKRGSGFDLGIAMAILAAAGSVPDATLGGLVLIGELGLDGRVRPVPGVLPAAAAAAAAGFSGVVVAEQNAAEAALVSQLQVVATPSLEALTAWVRAGKPPGQTVVSVLAADRDSEVRPEGLFPVPAGTRAAQNVGTMRAAGPAAAPQAPAKDLADLVGQPLARRAAEVCAAGGHHIMLLGPPGVGKPMHELKSVWPIVSRLAASHPFGWPG